MRCIADVVGEMLIVDASAKTMPPTQRAVRTRACSRVLGPFKLASNSRIMDSDNFPIGGLDGWATASDVGWNPDQWTRTIQVV